MRSFKSGKIEKMITKKIIWIVKLEEPTFSSFNFRYFRSHLIAETLLKRGHYVRFFTSSHSNSGQRNYIKKSYNRKNFQYVFLDGKINFKNSYFLKLLSEFFSSRHFIKKVKNLTEKPDVIITCIPSIIFSKVIADFCNKFKIKYIVDYRDLHPDIYSEELSFYKKILAYPLIILFKKYLKFICNNSSGLIGINKFFTKHLNKYLTEKKKIPSKTFELSYKPIFKCNKIINKKIKINKIIFVGKINKVFISAYRNFFANYSFNPSIKIYFVGDGRFVNEFKNQINEHKNIYYLGNLSQKKIISLFANMDAMLYLVENRLDYLNSLPNKFFEAIYYKLPIITYNKGLVKTVLSKYNIGMYCNNFNSLQKKLMNKNLFINYSINRKKFLKKYSFQNIYFRYAKFIENIITTK